jgi:SOS-response transcriptional repressor LexA
MPSTELRVKELLKERKWTTKILAEKTGMSESYLTHIKNGTRRWNEDALRRMADAFEVEPIMLFTSCKSKKKPLKALVKEETERAKEETSKISKVLVQQVPMMGEIPSYPSSYNNKMMQMTTGYREMFAPVINENDSDMFCLVIENQSLVPRFLKGDLIIMAPASSDQVNSGDIVAVEYETDKKHKALVTISFLDNFIMLESVNHKQPPVALQKGRDPLRIIGKIAYV